MQSDACDAKARSAASRQLQTAVCHKQKSRNQEAAVKSNSFVHEPMYFVAPAEAGRARWTNKFGVPAS
jgi:hypothetical protein